MDKVIKMVIIGGGPAGLITAKYALQHSITSLLVLEENKEIGGIWNPDSGYAWDSMSTNTSKYNSSFSVFPWPKEAPTFPNCREVFKYLQAFAE